MMNSEWDLLSAFSLHPSDLVAFVGGGGKTSLMFALARALPGRVIITTTTRIFAAQMRLAPAVLTVGDGPGEQGWRELTACLEQHGRCLIVGQVDGEKALGVSPALPGQWLARPDVDFVLVEADGSRMRPIKAPAAHEPVIPPETTLLVPVVGIDALNGRLADVAHRPELVAGLVGAGDQFSVFSEQFSVFSERHLTPGDVAAVLTHPQGGLKGAPAGARVIPFINKVETADQLAAARQIARRALRAPRIAQVGIGAVRGERPVWELHRRVTAVVLAAGQASRMGQTKQLLPWGETTVLGQTVRNLQASAVYDILVVSGHEAEAVAEVAAEAGVPVIHNPHYATGEMLSSLQTAVRRLPEQIEAVLVMLADQPMVEPATIDRLLAAYWQGRAELIAPMYEGQRGNPVLIGRRYFADLLSLSPGAAPRDLLKRYAADLRLVDVGTDTILRDLDRPEEYARWRP